MKAHEDSQKQFLTHEFDSFQMEIVKLILTIIIQFLLFVTQ